MYKWVDENEIVHYSDTPPPNDTPKKSEVEKLPTVQSTYVEEPDTNKDNNSKKKKTIPKEIIEEEEKEETKSKSRYLSRNEVELFTTSWCYYCKKAKKFLESRGVTYTEYDVEKDQSAAKRFKMLNRKGGVPFAIINGQSISGFKESLYEAFLKKK